MNRRSFLGSLAGISNLDKVLKCPSVKEKISSGVVLKAKKIVYLLKVPNELLRGPIFVHGNGFGISSKI